MERQRKIGGRKWGVFVLELEWRRKFLVRGLLGGYKQIIIKYKKCGFCIN